MSNPHELSDAEFEVLVNEGIETIPPHFLEKLENVAITIADEPTRQERKRMGLGGRDTLYGLYEGIPLTARGENYGFVLPDKITIFKRPILEEGGGDKARIREIVRDTVWHELAHYFGYDDHAIEAREEKGRNYAGAHEHKISVTPFLFLHLLLASPRRQYVLIALIAGSLFFDFVNPGFAWLLWVGAVAGGLPVFVRALVALRRREITIDTFNLFALGVSFAIRDVHSACFIVLMLTFADLLDYFTDTRMTNAVGELLRLKPNTASRERDGKEEKIPTDRVITGDVLIVRSGDRIPVDGIVIFGDAFVNEASVTGESVPIYKGVGDQVLSSTVNESNVIKIRATAVGKDSTIERMAALIKNAAAHKSRSEKLADRFARLFLPIVLVLGGITYFIGGPVMMAALFVVACADDMAVAIPLAITGALGVAAKRGVIVKGGEWLYSLAHVDTLVLDKTGTLTYGTLNVGSIELANAVSPKEFWELVLVAEKLSEHPVGRAMVNRALLESGLRVIPDPEESLLMKGIGICAAYKGHTIAIGNEKIIQARNLPFSGEVSRRYNQLMKESVETLNLVYIDGKYAGMIGVADVARKEAKIALETLSQIGIGRIIMLTGDNAVVAERTARELGITEWRAGVSPEGKLDILDVLAREGRKVAMVGDGINDAPALTRADVGLAMGGGGTAVAVEAANIVVLTDDLSRIPEMILLARRTVSVVSWDMVTWLVTNAIGFGLVWTGILGPALAAAYNFGTDFLPVLNSTRLFRNRK